MTPSVTDILITLSGTSNSISQIFDQPIILNDEHYTHRITLDEFTMYNSIPNITNENNSIKIKDENSHKEWATISIPIGAYEVDQIYEMIVTDLDNLKFKNVDKNFKFIPMISTKQVYIELGEGWSLSFDVDGTMAPVLGFDRKDKLIGPIIGKGKHPVMINTTDEIIFKSNIVAPSLIKGKDEPVLYIHPIDVPPGYKMIRGQSNDNSYMALSTNTLDNIKVWLEDEKGKPIDIRKEKLSVSLKLRSTERNHKYIKPYSRR